jgi:hypothetical protein
MQTQFAGTLESGISGGYSSLAGGASTGTMPMRVLMMLICSGVSGSRA